MLTIYNMKKALTIFVAFILAGSVIPAYAARVAAPSVGTEMTKASKDELNAKASKTARKEAKKFEKEGWKTAPGALPLEKQLDRSYLMQMEYGDDGIPAYIMAEGKTTAGNYDAAKMQAMEMARQNLAGQIQSEINSQIDSKISTGQFNREEAESLTLSVASSHNRIAQTLGRIVPVVEVYRDNRNGRTVEVLVRLSYSMKEARRVTMQAMQNDLKERSDALSEKLDQLLGW